MKSSTKLYIYQAAVNGLGENIPYKLHRSMCIRRLRHAGCIFIHIPKSAGTSIATAVIGKRAGHYSASELKAAMGASKFDSFFSFAITRHPVDRLLSAYHYALNRGGSQGAMQYDPVYDSQVFSSFDKFVNEWLVKQDLWQMDYVFRPQRPFIYEGDDCLVDYIGCVEEMDSVETRLSAALGKTLHIPKRNTNLVSSDTKKDISTYTLRSIYDLYRDDFEQFGYTLVR